MVYKNQLINYDELPVEESHPGYRKPFRAYFKDINQLERLKHLMLGLPIQKTKGIIPWGYRLDPDDKQGLRLDPIDKCFVALVKAKEYLKEATYASVADWISEVTGHPINANTLQQLFKHRFPDDRAALTRKERWKAARNSNLV